jgi:hypothetical protein
MKLSKLGKDIGLVIVSGLIAILIVAFSTASYEWMVGDHDTDGNLITLCSMPQDRDSPRLIMSMLMLVPVLGLAALICVMSRTRFRLMLGCALFAFWLYRFFLRFAGCSA